MIFLEQAFWQVIEMSWYACPVIGSIFCIRWVARNRLPSWWLYSLWMLAVARLFLPILLLPSSPFNLQSPSDKASLAIEQSIALADSSGPSEIKPSPFNSREPAIDTSSPTTIKQAPAKEHFYSSGRWWPILASIWLSVVAGLLTLGFIAHVRLVRLVTRKRTMISENLAAQWAETWKAAGVTTGPEIWISSGVKSPVLLGIYNPKVVLPQTANNYTPDEIRHILMHELAHYKRKDHLMNALHLAAVVVHWFNPLVWLSLYGARLDRECAADEWALGRLSLTRARDYCETILKLVQRQSNVLVPVMGIAENPSDLKQRLLAIIKFKPGSSWQSIALLLSILVLAVPALSKDSISGGTRGQIYDRNGVVLATSDNDHTRLYPNGSLAAHLLGHCGKSDGVYQGTLGVERGMNSQLSANVSMTGPHNVYLTIDSRIQRIVETSLKKSPFQRAAAVVMDPNNGDILAIASLPTYDPNVFANPVQPDVWKRLMDDPQQPLLNRAVNGYTPGSAFKPLVALAGIKSGIVNVNTEFDSPGQITIGDHIFHNSDSKDAGTIGLATALQTSNDVYFYRFAMKCGMGCIDDLGRLAGFGHRWNVSNDGDDAAGVLPGPDWLKERDQEDPNHGLKWTDAQTANTGIGQGYVICTPLQLTAFYCAIANGGTVYTPRLYKRVTDSAGNTVHDSFTDPITSEGRVFNKLGVKTSDLKVIQDSLLAVVNSGTGQLAQIPGVAVCGKTGSAEAWRNVKGVRERDIKGWFCCYAPAERPRYTVTVVCEGATWGGTSSAPIAREILEQLLAPEKEITEKK